jgi:hypothetical protein
MVSTRAGSRWPLERVRAAASTASGMINPTACGSGDNGVW